MDDLASVELKISYTSPAQDLVPEFYIPCLKRSTRYRRGVAYFTSHGLALAAQGVAHLIANGGRIQLIASPVLSEDDVGAINRGYRSREEVLRDSTSRSLAEIHSDLVADRLGALAWLVSNDLMDIKLALRVDDKGQLANGIYHEKLGIFTDSAGQNVVFVGSSNETAGGLVDNFESIEVFWSWDDPHLRVPPKVRHFDSLWRNLEPRIQIVEFTHIAAELLERYRQSTQPTADPLDRKSSAGSPAGRPTRPTVPPSIQLRDYQEEARDSWFDNHGRGILKMATGTGKTITALSIVTRLAMEARLKAVVVVCPFRHLVKQWEKEARSFGMSPVLAFESAVKWKSRLSDNLYNLPRNDTDFLCVITTNATFAAETFQVLIPKFPMATVLVVDEVHNLGAERLRRVLPNSIGLRLGLSATPERWFDDKGTSGLLSYFGPVLKPELTLADALRRGCLVPYRYFPVLVHLTEEEHDEYLQLSTMIARVAARSVPDEVDGRLQNLLIRRARLLAAAKNKLDELRRIMRQRANSTHTLVYCGTALPRIQSRIRNSAKSMQCLDCSAASSDSE